MIFDYQLIRSDRRTLSLIIDAQGALIVRAPRKLSVANIEHFISQKAGWIAAKQLSAEQRKQSRANHKLTENEMEGAQLPYLGGMLTLHFADSCSPQHNGSTLLLPKTHSPAISLKAWMKKEAQRVLTPRVHYHAQRLGLTPTNIAYTTAKKRWGSMSSSGSLRLNVALLHCPMLLIDYVIVHELSHILHPNHSPAFHAHVRQYLPNADRLQKELKLLAHLTTLLDFNKN